MTSGPNEKRPTGKTSKTNLPKPPTEAKKRRTGAGTIVKKEDLLKLITLHRIEFLQEVLLTSLMVSEEALMTDKALNVAIHLMAKNIAVPFSDEKMLIIQREIIEREKLATVGVMQFRPTLENLILIVVTMVLAAPNVQPELTKKFDQWKGPVKIGLQAEAMTMALRALSGLQLALKYYTKKDWDEMVKDPIPMDKLKIIKVLPKSLSQFAKLFEKDNLPVPPLLKKVVDAMEQTGKIQA